MDEEGVDEDDEDVVDDDDEEEDEEDEEEEEEPGLSALYNKGSLSGESEGEDYEEEDEGEAEEEEEVEDDDESGKFFTNSYSRVSVRDAPYRVNNKFFFSISGPPKPKKSKPE